MAEEQPSEEDLYVARIESALKGQKCEIYLHQHAVAGTGTGVGRAFLGRIDEFHERIDVYTPKLFIHGCDWNAYAMLSSHTKGDALEIKIANGMHLLFTECELLNARASPYDRFRSSEHHRLEFKYRASKAI